MFRQTRAREERLALLAMVLVTCVPCCTFPDFAIGIRSDAPSGGADSSNAGAATSGGSAARGGSAGGDPTLEGGMASAGVPDASAGESGEIAGAGGNASSGKLLFFDDFESGNADNWAPNTLGDWSVVSSGGSQVYKQGTKGAALRLASAGDKNWANVAVEARIKIISFGGTSTADLVGLYARFRDLDNYYYAALRADGKVALKAQVGGSESPLGQAIDVGITTNTWYRVLLEVEGSEIRVSVDDQLVQSATDDSLATGAIAVGEDNATVLFDDVKVTAL